MMMDSLPVTAVCIKVLDEGEIVNVAVAPQFRRKGIAHAMLDVILGDGYSKDLACIFLEVREHNLPRTGTL